MAENRNILIRALQDYEAAASFSLPEWDQCIRMARHANLLSRISLRLQKEADEGKIAPKVREHLRAARVVADQHERIMRWEIEQVQELLGPGEIQVVLLKGAAYVARELPPSQGRLYSDIDIMVPLAEIGRVEAILLQNGWEHTKLEPYDQKYYRKWMHELPPLRHQSRKTCLDVHHTILPRTGRIRIDSNLLFKAAVPVQRTSLWTLSPTDMVLHSAAHLFQDGDLGSGLRDLTDLDDLFRHYGSNSDFWAELISRARELNLLRPLFYAFRYAQKILKTPLPESALRGAAAGAPPPIALNVMDCFVSKVLTPLEPIGRTPGAGFARWFLYVRSHYLRMPPGLLFVHLLRKALRVH